MKMAQLQITIDLDNDALRNPPDNVSDEVARILATIARRFYEAKDSGHWLNAHDINGNPVGKFKVDSEATPSFS